MGFLQVGSEFCVLFDHSTEMFIIATPLIFHYSSHGKYDEVFPLKKLSLTFMTLRKVVFFNFR